jgi:alpha-beta hydrolase superfamily lysophospholipase
VVGDDHRGHGKRFENNLGHVGKNISHIEMVDDLVAINQFIQKTYPMNKIIVYGHSFGSFLARILISKPKVKVTGAILSGTGFENKFNTKFALGLIGLIKLFRGDAHHS